MNDSTAKIARATFSRAEVTLLLKKLLNESPNVLNDATLNENTDWDENNLLEFAESLLPTDQAAPKREEEIEALAHNHVKKDMGEFYNKDGFDTFKNVEFFVDGYKAALQSLEKEPEDRWTNNDLIEFAMFSQGSIPIHDNLKIDLDRFIKSRQTDPQPLPSAPIKK